MCAESLAEGYAPKRHIDQVNAVLQSFGHDVVVVGRDDGPYHTATDRIRLGRYVYIARHTLRAMTASDVIVTRGHFAHYPWSVVAKLRGKPVVHILNGWINDAPTTYNVSSILRSLIAWSYRRQFASARAIVCVTREIANHVLRLDPNLDVEVVGNTTDPTMFAPTGDAQTGNYAIFPSSLAKWHGVATLLQAASDPGWPANLDVVIAGDGQQSRLVAEHANRNPRVRYLGVLTSGELARWMRGARMGLCLIEPVPGRQVKEVYPLKLFEMMACGLPMIATDLPGQSAVIFKANAGLLVPAGDPGALARAVKALDSSPDRARMAASAAEAVLELRSQEQSAAQLERIIAAAAYPLRRR